jgi:hypothetical protein
MGLAKCGGRHGGGWRPSGMLDEELGNRRAFRLARRARWRRAWVLPTRFLHCMAATGTSDIAPEDTVLYRAVRSHWDAFRERMEAIGSLPRFVVREVEDVSVTASALVSHPHPFSVPALASVPVGSFQARVLRAALTHTRKPAKTGVSELRTVRWGGQSRGNTVSGRRESHLGEAYKAARERPIHQPLRGAHTSKPPALPGDC